MGLTDVTIPGLRLGQALGEGAASVVYAGEVEATGQAVAVKVVRPGLPLGAAIAERTLQEAHISWTINHPHVVRVHDFGRTSDGVVYLVMERLIGETLHSRLRREGTLGASVALHIVRQLARGLCAIHAQGAVHRDIKPENVFLCSTGPTPDFVKLLDLGIALLPFDDPHRMVKTRTGVVFGTPGFVAPEQARGEPLDGRCDLFALGATMYNALVGEPPFMAPTIMDVLVKVAGAKAPPPLPGWLPPDVARLLSDLLEPDPSRRTPDAEALLLMVERAQGAPPSGFSKTTVVLDGAAVRLGDLHLPTLGDAADHQRFRAHVLRAIAQLFPPGHIPALLREHLAAIDRLNDERERLAAIEDERRRAAGTLAAELSTRSRRLAEARSDLDATLAVARGDYTRQFGRLVSLADRVGDIDRLYTDGYRRAERAQRDAAEQAAASESSLGLQELYGDAVSEVLGALAALQEKRARILAEQADVREALREHHRVVCDLTAQRIELDRSLLAVESDRRTRLAPLEEEARSAEDQMLILDRSLEHAYFSLGAALQRELHERR